ncbi:MAG: hypothetical protein ACRYGF_11785, partial [Janthinobacterium lividum]
ARGSEGLLLSLAEPAMLAVLILYLLYEFLLSHVEGDQAYLLYAAQQMLHGVQLDGPRLIETNPPLVVWFSILPAALAQWLHVDVVLCLRLVVLAMLASSAAWGRRLLQLAPQQEMFGKRGARVLWAATFLLIVVTQPAEFGQREQLLLALLLPYLLAVGTGAVQRLQAGERVALGLCAGLAVCFKPQHLITFICVELFLAGYARSLRRLRSPEVLAAVATGLLYVAAVWMFTPAYFTEITPLLQSTYWALGEYSYGEMLLQVGRWLTLLTLVLGIAWFALRKRLRVPQLSGCLFAGAAGAVLAYFVQHTGWYHQRFPAVALLEISTVWIAADLGCTRIRVAAVRPRLRAAAWIGLPICALVAFATVLVHKRHALPVPDDMTAEMERVPPGTTVYAFSVGMNAFPVVLERHLVWGSRFAHLWMVPAIRANEAPGETGRDYHHLDPARIAELGALQRSETAEDLQRTRPAVIFVERCDATHACESYRSPFDAVQWFSKDSRFAEVWRGYQLEKSIVGFDVYRRTQATNE